MQRQAAGKIDRGIGKVKIPAENPQTAASQPMTDFKLKRGKRRCWSSGYLGQTKGGRWNIQDKDRRSKHKAQYRESKSCMGNQFAKEYSKQGKGVSAIIL